MPLLMISHLGIADSGVRWDGEGIWHENLVYGWHLASMALRHRVMRLEFGLGLGAGVEDMSHLPLHHSDFPSLCSSIDDECT